MNHGLLAPKGAVKKRAKLVRKTSLEHANKYILKRAVSAIRARSDWEQSLRDAAELPCDGDEEARWMQRRKAIIAKRAMCQEINSLVVEMSRLLRGVAGSWCASEDEVETGLSQEERRRIVALLRTGRPMPLLLVDQ